MAKINKLSPQKAVRKKLDFKQLPLSGKTIYLDIKDARQRRKLEETLKQLGAQVEKFLSKEINYVISSNTTTTLANNKKDGQNDRPDSPSFISTPSPFNCPGGSPNSLENNKHKTQTRAQAMVKLAQSQTQTTPVLQNAERFGIKVIPVEAALKWVEKESSKLQAFVSNAGKSQPSKKSRSEIKVKKLLAPWVKFEAANSHYRPIYSELGSFPYCNVDTPAGTCPFDGSSVSRAQKTEPEFRDKVVASPGDGQNKDGETPRNSLNSKGQNNNDSTSKMFGMPILTAGDLKRRKEKKRSVEKKSGYCECCTLRYDDIDKHLRGEDHRTFARNKDNFAQLDDIIKTLNSPALFLRKILHEHCQRKVQLKKHSKMVEEKEVERKRETQEIETPVDPVVEGEVVKSSEVKENNLRRRVGGSRRFPSSLSGAKTVVENDNKTTAANVLCQDKIPIISPCSVVVKSLNSWINLPKEPNKESHSLGPVKQKLVIKNMAIGSLQVASTSPDKIVRMEKKSTKNAESENSKDSYFSTDRDASSSSEENEVVFKNSELATKSHKEKSVLRKKVSHKNTGIMCRQLRTRSVKKDASNNFYINRVKSAKKQLTRKSQKDKEDLKAVKLMKLKPRNNSASKKDARSTPTVSNKKLSGHLQTESGHSSLKVDVPSVSDSSIAKIPYNSSHLSFPKHTGRKSRNSMEVEFHDLMILNSLTENFGQKKKSSKSKPSTVTSDDTASVNHTSPVKPHLIRVLDSPNETDVIQSEQNSIVSRLSRKEHLQSSMSDRFQKRELSLNSRTRSQVNSEAKDLIENNSLCTAATSSSSYSEPCKTIKEGEKTLTFEMGCGEKNEKLSSIKRSESPNSYNILLKALTVTLEPIDSLNCPSPIFSPKSNKLQQLSPEKQHIVPDIQMPSPVFDKSPAFQPSGKSKNSSGNSSRKINHLTPAKSLYQPKDEILDTPRSGYSSTPRRRVKRQRRQKNLTCASQLPLEIFSCAEPESSLPLECKNTRRSLENELAEVQRTSPSLSANNQTGKTSTPTKSCLQVFCNIEESVKSLQPVKEECATPQTSYSVSSIYHVSTSVNNSMTGQKSSNLLNIIDDSFGSSSKKRVKLSHNWKVLSDRSLNKLLASEVDHTPFLGFEEKDTQSCTLSDLSFEEQSEIDIDNSESHEWVINCSASDGSDFDHLLPDAYSSPSKASNSSWFDACESFLVTCSSTPATSADDRLSGKSPRKRKEATNKKNKTKRNKNICETDNNPESQQSLSVQCVEQQPGLPLSGEVHVMRTPRRKRIRPQDSAEQTVDEDIVFNFNSPQKNKRKFSNIQIQSPDSDSNMTSPPPKRYRLLKNVSDVKAKFNMNYFRKEKRGAKSPNQIVKKLNKDIRLHKLNKARAEVVIVPPKSSVVRR